MRSRSPAGRCRIWLSRPLPRGARPGSLAPPLLLLGLILVWSGCGIEEYALPLAPPQGPVAGAQYFEFRATADNSEADFRGFELYYKIYLWGDETGRNTDQQLIQGFRDLSLRGFRRIHRSTDSTSNVSRPLINVAPADRGEDFVVRVSFFGTDSYGDLTPPTPFPAIFATGPGLLFPATIASEDIRRGVAFPAGTLNAGQFKRFSDFVENGDIDEDVTQAIWDDISTLNAVSIVLYVLSYGLDIVLNQELYSLPLRLGELSTITFPPDANS